jgi:hypothetical protein
LEQQAPAQWFAGQTKCPVPVAASLKMQENITYLDHLIPTGRDERVRVGLGRETDGRDPVGVRSLTLKGVLAFTNGVPDTDGAVAAGRNNLTVVRRERNREDITRVANKAADSLAVGKIPQTKSLIPRGRDGIRTVLRDSNILDNVRVALERAERDTIGSLITGKVPDDQSLVTRTRNENLRVTSRGGEGSDPSVVSIIPVNSGDVRGSS